MLYAPSKIQEKQITEWSSLEGFYECIVGNPSLAKYEMASDILKISCYKNSEILPSQKTPVTVSEDYLKVASSKTEPVKLNCIWEFRVDF